MRTPLILLLCLLFVLEACRQESSNVINDKIQTSASILISPYPNADKSFVSFEELNWPALKLFSAAVESIWLSQNVEDLVVAIDQVSKSLDNLRVQEFPSYASKEGVLSRLAVFETELLKTKSIIEEEGGSFRPSLEQVATQERALLLYVQRQAKRMP